MANIQLLLLAAGASKRMGRPKQLLEWGNVTLIEHQIKNLLSTDYPLSVILGANSEEIIRLIKSLPIEIYKNEEWEQGMGSSIAFGVRQLLENDSTIDGVLISLIDQPLLTKVHFIMMLDLFQKGKGQIIVSHSKNGWSGAPVLFDKKYFDELLDLKGDEGAKIITSKNKNSVKSIDGGEIMRDLDAPEAYNELLNIFNQRH